MKNQILLFAISLFLFNNLNAQCWIKAKAGFQHNLAIAHDTTLWAWGSNEMGQLGMMGINKSLPVKVNDDRDWARVFPGGDFSLALKLDGTLWAWGANDKGQLGIGAPSAEVYTPTQVNVDTDWDTIVAARRYVLALKTDGTLWAWGDNFDNGAYRGCLGNGQATNLAVPTQIGTDSDWTHISAYSIASMALKEDGSRWAWGQNTTYYGSGSSAQYDVPTMIDVGENWRTIAMGNSHVLAIKNDGTLWAWGLNSNGKLGTGDTQLSDVPKQVGTDTDWKSCQASVWHSVGLKEDGKVYAWGKNDNGLAGLGNNFIVPVIPTLVEADTTWDQISVGTLHSISVKNDSIYSWGLDGFGQLGRVNSENNFPNIVECPEELLLNVEYVDFANSVLEVFPNPADQMLNMRLVTDENPLSIRVMNTIGEAVISTSYSDALNISNLPTGLYILQITTDDNNLYSSLFTKI